MRLFRREVLLFFRLFRKRGQSWNLKHPSLTWSSTVRPWKVTFRKGRYTCLPTIMAFRGFCCLTSGAVFWDDSGCPFRLRKCPSHLKNTSRCLCWTRRDHQNPCYNSTSQLSCIIYIYNPAIWLPWKKGRFHEIPVGQQTGSLKRDPYISSMKHFMQMRWTWNNQHFKRWLIIPHAGDKVAMSRMGEQTSLNGKKHHYLAQSMIERP